MLDCSIYISGVSSHLPRTACAMMMMMRCGTVVVLCTYCRYAPRVCVCVICESTGWMVWLWLVATTRTSSIQRFSISLNVYTPVCVSFDDCGVIHSWSLCEFIELPYARHFRFSPVLDSGHAGCARYEIRRGQSTIPVKIVLVLSYTN